MQGETLWHREKGFACSCLTIRFASKKDYDKKAAFTDLLSVLVGKRGKLIQTHLASNFGVLIISSCQFVTYHCVSNQSKYTIPDQNIPEPTRAFSKYTNGHHSGLTQIAQSHSSRYQSKSFQTGSLSSSPLMPYGIGSDIDSTCASKPKIILFGIIFPSAVNESKLPCPGWLSCTLFYNQF